MQSHKMRNKNCEINKGEINKYALASRGIKVCDIGKLGPIETCEIEKNAKSKNATSRHAESKYTILNDAKI